jgi:hypothetical protein
MRSTTEGKTRLAISLPPVCCAAENLAKLSTKMAKKTGTARVTWERVRRNEHLIMKGTSMAYYNFWLWGNFCTNRL